MEKPDSFAIRKNVKILSPDLSSISAIMKNSATGAVCSLPKIDCNDVSLSEMNRVSLVGRPHARLE